MAIVVRDELEEQYGPSAHEEVSELDPKEKSNTRPSPGTKHFRTLG